MSILKIYFVCSKFTLMLFYIMLLLLTVLGLLGVTVNADSKLVLLNEEERRHYLTDLGLIGIEGPIETKVITIPWQFGDVYSQYNELQREANWDLLEYAGKTLNMFTYSYKDLLVHLIINDNGEVVGGDICDPSINGFMLPLTQQYINEINST